MRGGRKKSGKKIGGASSYSDKSGINRGDRQWKTGSGDGAGRPVVRPPNSPPYPSRPLVGRQCGVTKTRWMTDNGETDPSSGRRIFSQLDELRTEVQRRDQELLGMSAKMKTLEEQHQDYQRHIAVLKESLCAKEEHYNMLQADVRFIYFDFYVFFFFKYIYGRVYLSLAYWGVMC